MFIDKGKDAIDEFLTLEIRELAELGSAAEMSGIEGIASGTTQRTFFGDFDGKRWRAAAEDTSPCLQDFGCFHDLSQKSGGTGWLSEGNGRLAGYQLAGSERKEIKSAEEVCKRRQGSRGYGLRERKNLAQPVRPLSVAAEKTTPAM